MKCSDLFRFAQIVDAAISPAGDAVAYVTRSPNESDDRYDHELKVAPLPSARGGASATVLGRALSAPAWAPDSRRLAAVESHGGQPASVILLAATGGERRPLAAGLLDPGCLAWSPDGRELAFLALTPAGGSAIGAGVPDPEAARRVSPTVVESLSAKLDGLGTAALWRRHLLTVDTSTGAVRQLTDGDLWVDGFCYSPSSALIAWCGASIGSGAVPRQPGTVRPSALWLMDRQGGDSRPLTVMEAGARCPVFTRDGSHVVFAGLPGLRADLLGLFSVPVAGGPVARLAGDLDRSLVLGDASSPVGHPPVTGPGAEMFFCARDGGCVQLYEISLHAPASSRILAGSAAESVGAVSTSDTGEYLAYVASAADGSQRLTVLDLSSGARTVLAEIAAQDGLVLARPIQFTARDGVQLQGWLIRRRDSGRTPLLVDMHGGSFSGAWSPLVQPSRLYQQELAADGWTILLLNARGSDGYGSEFARAALGAWGAADAPDIQDSIDVLISQNLVDPARLAVTGYSYGGFMSNWLTATSNRFRAAVAGGSICDFVSLFGTSDMGWALSEYDVGVRPCADPLDALRRSPVALGRHVRTPTLLLHGESDLRCPISQAEEWLALLLSSGCTATLVRYPSADHGFLTHGRPSFAVDYGQRLVAWMNRYVSDAAAPGGPGTGGS